MPTKDQSLERIVSSIALPENETTCKQSTFEHIRNQDFLQAYCLKVAFWRRKTERPFPAYYGNVTWLRDLWEAIDVDTLTRAADGDLRFSVKGLLSSGSVMLDRLTRSIPSAVLKHVSEQNIDDFRAAICMQDNWPPEESFDWLPSVLKTMAETEKVPSSFPIFTAPEYTLQARRATTTKRSARTQVILQNGNMGIVEEFVLAHFLGLGLSGFYAENLFWWQMMTFLYWDILNTHLEDEHPSVQTMNDLPSDLFSQRLWQRRQPQIDLRSQELLYFADRHELGRELCRIHESFPYFRIRWFFGKTHALDEFLLAINSIQPKPLVALLNRLISNYSEVRTGLPDLFLVYKGIPKFVEVKQTRERVSQIQAEWHEFLHGQGVAIEVWRVKAANS